MSRGWWLVLIVVALLVVGGAAVLRKISETEAGRLAKLRPEVRAAWERLRADAAAEGIQLYVISTARSEAEQAAEVTAGTSGTDDSWHELRRAIDFQVQWRDPLDGKLKADHKAIEVARYRRVHELSKRHGFRGIPKGSPFDAQGNPAYITNRAGKKIWDVYHLEWTEGLTFAQAAARDKAAA